MKGDLFGKLFQSYLSPSSADDQKVRRRRAGILGWSLGKSGDFCSMFGCNECVKKAGAVCCEGYLYDERSNECRLVVLR
ncbi:hypothetical protein TNIN_271001 [Trichonephila inaurata madagascariensis]|uniref:Uncharacterized protein n=1 Tax=Trichonephila inaurata madagascariensis TaxID=2747483 RepID=A0A8X7BN49_9ARAC|nr:hypothetical protein TNIN_271001 [Trichonephila inaurata madagascariensis]